MTLKLSMFSFHMSDTDLLGGDYYCVRRDVVVVVVGGGDKYMTLNGLGYEIASSLTREHTSVIRSMMFSHSHSVFVCVCVCVCGMTECVRVKRE